MRSRENLKSSSTTNKLNGKRQIKYSLRPSIDFITKKVNPDFSFRASISSDKSTRSSITINSLEETGLPYQKSHQSFQPINPSSSSMRSLSMVTNLFPNHRPRSTHWRQGSIVDPNQMALIQFTLPSHNNDSKYRRRSVAVCSNIIEPRENPITTIDSILPCLLSFSIIYLKTSQIKIEFHSLQSLPLNIQFQQLTIKVKLMPDGKEKSSQIKKFIQNETTFEDEKNQFFVLFSNISFEKLHEKILSLTIHGKDQTKKNIHLGHIGKIYFNQINRFDNENQIHFIHEIEKIKPVNSNFHFYSLFIFFSISFSHPSNF